MMSNLPPGVRARDLPGCDDDAPCAVCALDPAECVCPECPVCRTNGDPSCYADAQDFYGLPAYYPPHGLVRSLGQVVLRAATLEFLPGDRWDDDDDVNDPAARERLG